MLRISQILNFFLKINWIKPKPLFQILAVGVRFLKTTIAACETLRKSLKALREHQSAFVSELPTAAF